MKYFLLLLTMLFYSSGSKAQSELQEYLSNSKKMPLYGTDVTIKDAPDQNQRNVKICSAFNGWLYAVYTHNVGITPYFAIMRSEDNGKNWELKLDAGPIAKNKVITCLDIVATGNSLENLKLLMGYVFHDTLNDYYGAFIPRYNGLTLEIEDEILQSNSYETKYLALSTDYPFPVNGSNPQTLGVLYSVGGGIKDSVIFQSSTNGGISLGNKITVATSSNVIKKVSLSFGRSYSESDGRYFAAWEDQQTDTSSFGHIYTSRSGSNLTSQFTSPICLDCSNPELQNNCRNPKIECQVSNTDNDSLNLTEICLIETNLQNVKGLFNVQATSGTLFTEFQLDIASVIKLSPDMAFNPVDSTFNITYFDPTNKKLRILSHNFNMINPSNWNLVSDKYNDDINILYPYPQIKYSASTNSTINVWNAESNGKGKALFDAPYIYYTGTGSHDQNQELVKVYPNPCITTATFQLDIIKESLVTISIYDDQGRLIEEVLYNKLAPGIHKIVTDLDRWSPGLYYFRFENDGYKQYGKIMKF